MDMDMDMDMEGYLAALGCTWLTLAAFGWLHHLQSKTFPTGESGPP